MQTLTHCLSFASALAKLCMVDEESRWSLLPALLARAARLGIESDKLNALVDGMVRRWREWGATLHLRTQDLPPFAEILAASPPMRRMGSSGDSENKRCRTPSLLVQLLGIVDAERTPLTQQIEELGHRVELLEATDLGWRQALERPGQIIIVEMASAGAKAADFCRQLRQSARGKDSYALLLASPELENRALQAVDAGADDVLIKPLNAQTLRVHLNAATHADPQGGNSARAHRRHALDRRIRRCAETAAAGRFDRPVDATAQPPQRTRFPGFRMGLRAG